MRHFAYPTWHGQTMFFTQSVIFTACPYLNMPDSANFRLLGRGNKKTPLAWIDDGSCEKKAGLGKTPKKTQKFLALSRHIRSRHDRAVSKLVFAPIFLPFPASFYVHRLHRHVRFIPVRQELYLLRAFFFGKIMVVVSVFARLIKKFDVPVFVFFRVRCLLMSIDCPGTYVLSFSGKNDTWSVRFFSEEKWL